MLKKWERKEEKDVTRKEELVRGNIQYVDAKASI
jgi:hypothetical protein